MAWAHDYLRAVVGGVRTADGYHWERILAALRVLEDDRSPESEAILRDVLRFEGALPLHEDSSLPHSMAPEHVLHSIAMHVLAEWDADKHRDVIAHVAETSRSAELVRIARGHLGT